MAVALIVDRFLARIIVRSDQTSSPWPALFVYDYMQTYHHLGSVVAEAARGCHQRSAVVAYAF